MVVRELEKLPSLHALLGDTMWEYLLLANWHMIEKLLGIGKNMWKSYGNEVTREIPSLEEKTLVEGNHGCWSYSMVVVERSLRVAAIVLSCRSPPNIASHKKTHYEVLSIKEDASYEEIRVSYKSAILNSHPDKVYNKSDSSRNYQEPKQEFLDVQKAWEVLSDVKLKAIYDKELQASREILELPANEIELGDMTLENDGDSQQLLYECRCGDYFLITSLDLKEMGILLDAVTLQLHSSIDSAPISVLIPYIKCGDYAIPTCLNIYAVVEMN
ncbi:hypothetical protein ZIOFF_015491 [Zingiber officinale]|uniref:J domain-containing protein n=1 Tax=Zingiber officinale TaxID=94328 RepID=A0A8J5HUK7_ZINOF|nr:hypothetical protein ZIOFF_015491 [Zingiber officinale]